MQLCYTCLLYSADNDEPDMASLQIWSKDSILRTRWYNFSVKLIGGNKTAIINAKHYGGGSHSCLQETLRTWWSHTTDHDWQVIIDALEKLEEFSLIESIENHFLEW